MRSDINEGFQLCAKAQNPYTLDQAVSEMTADESRLSTMSVLVYVYGTNVL